MSYTQLGLYIDDKWNHGNGGGGEDVLNPATQKPLAHLPHATTKDLDAALAAAEAGFKLWKAKSAYDRARIIKKAADLLRERADHVARVMTQEQGKVLAEAIRSAPGKLDQFAALSTPRFPGGKLLRKPALVAGMLWYALRDRI